MSRLRNRDINIINFISEFNVVNAKTIKELFFPSFQTMQRRMTKLCNIKELKRNRQNCMSGYYYYLKKPNKLLEHDLLVGDVYAKLKHMVDIKIFEREYSDISKIRPDAYIKYKLKNKHKNRIYKAFIEVEISNNGVNAVVEKYIKLHKDYNRWHKVFTVFPSLFLITNFNLKKETIQRAKDEEIYMLKIKRDLSDINKIIGV